MYWNIKKHTKKYKLYPFLPSLRWFAKSSVADDALTTERSWLTMVCSYWRWRCGRRCPTNHHHHPLLQLLVTSCCRRRRGQSASPLLQLPATIAPIHHRHCHGLPVLLWTSACRCLAASQGRVVIVGRERGGGVWIDRVEWVAVEERGVGLQAPDIFVCVGRPSQSNFGFFCLVLSPVFFPIYYNPNPMPVRASASLAATGPNLAPPQRRFTSPCFLLQLIAKSIPYFLSSFFP